MSIALNESSSFEDIDPLPSLISYDNILYETNSDLHLFNNDNFLLFFQINNDLVLYQLTNFYIFFIYLTLMDIS